MAQDQGRPQLILGLGIASLVLCYCGWLLGPVAWILGQGDLKKINAGEIDESARKNTQLGVYLGMGGTALGALIIVINCIYWIASMLFLSGTNK